MSALQKQIGGSHYLRFGFQPVKFIVLNDIGFAEGSVIKYVCRHEFKNGIEDLNKAMHYLEIIKEFDVSREGRKIKALHAFIMQDGIGLYECDVVTNVCSYIMTGNLIYIGVAIVSLKKLITNKYKNNDPKTIS